MKLVVLRVSSTSSIFTNYIILRVLKKSNIASHDGIRSIKIFYYLYNGEIVEVVYLEIESAHGVLVCCAV